MSGYFSDSSRAEFVFKILKSISDADDIRNLLPETNDIGRKDVINGIHMAVGKIDMDVLKRSVAKSLNLFYKSIHSLETNIDESSVIFYLIKDNEILQSKLNDFKKTIRQISVNKKINDKKEIVDWIEQVSNIGKHYTFKENILFPVVEKYYPSFQCLKVMWSVHDDIKNNLKELLKVVKIDVFNYDVFNILVGAIYFDIKSMIFRENEILFPVIEEIVPLDVRKSLIADGKEIGLSFVQLPDLDSKDTCYSGYNQKIIDLKTGSMTVEQIILMLNHLPVDITFVDENDSVVYFSTPKDRIFVRTNTIIGRKVQNCHPHESIDTVNKIIENFKNGSNDYAKFWINFNEKYIFIQYFAVRDDKGDYRGVLEVTQEVSEIKGLEGEKRLLDWG